MLISACQGVEGIPWCIDPSTPTRFREQQSRQHKENTTTCSRAAAAQSRACRAPAAEGNCRRTKSRQSHKPSVKAEAGTLSLRMGINRSSYVVRFLPVVLCSHDMGYFLLFDCRSTELSLFAISWYNLWNISVPSCFEPVPTRQNHTSPFAPQTRPLKTIEPYSRTVERSFIKPTFRF